MDSCRIFPQDHIPFSFIAITPELSDLIQQCKHNSHKINEICGPHYEAGVYWSEPAGECFNLPNNTIARKTQIGLGSFSFLLLLYAIKKTGLFDSAKHFIANRSVAHFFSVNKHLINESKQLLKLQEEIAEEEKANLEFKM